MSQQGGRQIVVEGPIAVGKSTLARQLAAHFNADLFLEAPHDNPYLPAYYNSPEAFALPTQLFFLLQRLQQRHDFSLSENQRDNVWDYFLDKDLLFANMTLNADDLNVYQSVYKRLTDPVREPDVVIYLKAPAPVLLSRLRKRARDYETGVSEDYLARLSHCYDEYFDDYDSAPVITINTENLDFARDKAALEELKASLSESGIEPY